MPTQHSTTDRTADELAHDDAVEGDAVEGAAGRLAALLERNPNLSSLLEIDLPVIAILAEKKVPLKTILELDVGSVIVFEKNDSDPIPLLVNNVQVGAGKTIKVGDHFGLHLRSYSRERVVDAVS